MAMPTFTSTNSSITPAGIDTFLVDRVEYIEEKDTFKVTYRMQKANRKHVEFYKVSVDYQINALGSMLRAAYKDETMEVFDEAILTGAVGRQFIGNIDHNEWQGKKRATINAFSYRPVEALYCFAKSLAEIINDEEPNDEEPVA